jgi:heme-degrading monooxygenase HmoA
MLVVIFEVEMRAGRAQEYFDLAAHLRTELQQIDGFISVERFESLTTPGKYLSLSLWRDERAVAAWKAHAEHRAAQQRGKEEIFARYRIRVAQVVRDYGSPGDTARQ